MHSAAHSSVSQEVGQMADENYDAGVFRFGIVPQPSDNTFEPGTHGLPSIEEREFGRVVVILGSNGAGKSRLLKLFTSRPEVNGELRPIVFVEGGRTCTVGPNGKPRPLELVQSNTQADRQQEVFNLVESDRRQAVWLHKKLLYEWDIKGADPKTKPNLHESRFDRVSAAFTSIFPHLTLVAYTHIVGDEQDPDGPTFQWWIRADGKAYHSSWASDGEKQVLTLLCDIGELARPHSLVIVDEPDLNLHPSLAITLWNEIERMQPDCIFVYATHSLSFAMRQNVSNVVVLRRKGQTPGYLDRPF
jgi:predicted ATPase